MKPGDRVVTPNGAGELKIIETIQRKNGLGEVDGLHYTGRVGVLHDVFPEGISRMYTDDILYYSSKEVTP